MDVLTASIPAMFKPHYRLHVGVNPLNQLYWWTKRDIHSTLYYSSAYEAVGAAITLGCRVFKSDVR